MPQRITTSSRAPVEAAEQEIESFSAQEAIALHGHDDVVLVDLCDIRELPREGRVTGAFHCPRGMPEFWIDPESKYHKPVFAGDNRFVFFCAAGQRPTLATQCAQRMGLRQVAHVVAASPPGKPPAVPSRCRLLNRRVEHAWL